MRRAEEREKIGDSGRGLGHELQEKMAFGVGVGGGDNAGGEGDREEESERESWMVVMKVNCHFTRLFYCITLRVETTCIGFF